MNQQMAGAEIVVQALKDQGVDTVFGYPGGAVLPIYDEIFKQNEIRHILVRHEQGATHAAEGYARSTGKPGVVLVTSGPGATNAVTGIATACRSTSGAAVPTPGRSPAATITSESNASNTRVATISQNGSRAACVPPAVRPKNPEMRAVDGMKNQGMKNSTPLSGTNPSPVSNRLTTRDSRIASR